MNKMTHYHPILRYLHWLVALLIFTIFAAGVVMVNIGDNVEYKWPLYSLHKLLGVIVFVFIIMRIVVRLITYIPKPDPRLSPLLAFLAKATHWALYALMFMVPFSGAMMAMLSGRGIGFFGYNLPNPFVKHEATAKLFYDMHGIVPYILMGVVMLHVAAFIKHQFVDKIDIWSRIKP